ncbi:unnamed protein product, partial [Mesorhabditis belari]|uniref:Uncharacterized protein n=1 Tax=Mesorhabditis belari TaxID=2138241 RepID=A0AAF3FKJ0_9BILA
MNYLILLPFTVITLMVGITYYLSVRRLRQERVEWKKTRAQSDNPPVYTIFSPPPVYEKGISDDFQALIKKHFPENNVLDDVLEAMKKRTNETQAFLLTNGTVNSTISDFPYRGHRYNMDEMSNFFAQLMNCAYGWCGYRCCGLPQARPVRLEYPSQYQQHYPSRYPQGLKTATPKYRKMGPKIGDPSPKYLYANSMRPAATTPISKRRPAVSCPKACQPQCLTSCMKRYSELVYEFMNSLTQTDILGLPNRPPQATTRRSIFEWGNSVDEDNWTEPVPSVQWEDERPPVCRADCMPLCRESCLLIEPKQNGKCRASCMPHCSQSCLDSPPLMLPCPDFDECYCPAGYVQCSESTCCMRYRAMAVRYKDKLAAYKFSDDKDTEPVSGNQTAVLAKQLRRLGGDGEETTTTVMVPGEAVKELPGNATIVYFPEEKRAEIRMNDGDVWVENVE